MSIIQGSTYEPGAESAPPIEAKADAPVVIVIPKSEPAPSAPPPAGWRWKISLPIKDGGSFDYEEFGPPERPPIVPEGLEQLFARLASIGSRSHWKQCTVPPQAAPPPPLPWWRRWFRC